MFMLDYKDIGWRYWLVTALFLTTGVAGYHEGFILAIGLSVIHLLHFVIREKGITGFPVQVRFWYLMLLLLSMVEQLHWLFWIPAIGTWAQVIFGYCAMARLVSLFPWNRDEAFSLGLIKQRFLSRPVKSLSVKAGH